MNSGLMNGKMAYLSPTRRLILKQKRASCANVSVPGPSTTDEGSTPNLGFFLPRQRRKEGKTRLFKKSFASLRRFYIPADKIKGQGKKELGRKDRKKHGQRLSHR